MLKIKIAEQAKYIKELEDGITSMNNKCVEIRRALESRIEKLEASIKLKDERIEWLEIRVPKDNQADHYRGNSIF